MLLLEKIGNIICCGLQVLWVLSSLLPRCLLWCFTDYRLVDCVYFLFLMWERLPIWMTETFWCVDSVVLITGDKMNKSYLGLFDLS